MTRRTSRVSPAAKHGVDHDDVDALRFALGEPHVQRQTEFRKILASHAAVSSTAVSSAATLLSLVVSGSVQTPTASYATGEPRRLRAKRFETARRTLETLQRQIDEVRQDIERFRVREQGGDISRDGYEECTRQIAWMSKFLDLSENEFPKNRSELWQLAVHIRGVLEGLKIPVGKTLSGAWRECLRYALTLHFPEDEVETVLESLKRQWDRDRAKGA